MQSENSVNIPILAEIKFQQKGFWILEEGDGVALISKDIQWE